MTIFHTANNYSHLRVNSSFGNGSKDYTKIVDRVILCIPVLDQSILEADIIPNTQHLYGHARWTYSFTIKSGFPEQSL